jgi:Lrp/AsnC family leucine-responsive transcriptional regulator
MDRPGGDSEYELDDIDRGVLYALQQDARNATAQSMAEQLGVSASTVRNRIGKLETAGVIQGYRPVVDYERAGHPLRLLFVGTAPDDDREAVADAASRVDGVVTVSEMLPSERNLRIEVATRDVAELRRVADSLADVGVRLGDVDVVLATHSQPFGPFEFERGRVDE